MGEIVRFIPKPELERARLIQEARAIYDSIFPPTDAASQHPDVDSTKGCNRAKGRPPGIAGSDQPRSTAAGILIVVIVPTALAIRTATACGMTLVGIVCGDEFDIFSHPGTIRPS